MLLGKLNVSPSYAPLSGGPCHSVTRGSGLSFLTQSGFPARKQHPARCVQLLCATDCVSGPSLLAGPGLSLLAYPCGGLILGVLRGDPAYSSQGALQCSRCQRAPSSPRRGLVCRRLVDPPRSGARSQALLERGRRLAASPALPWGSGEPGGVGSCEDVKERVEWGVSQRHKDCIRSAYTV